ncbi:MAG: Na+/H+ antiporter subunit E [Defluviitaleaceae bacterium]|nr:Na+/H+ antiporter subunit E [Defluviitaleaceae bacterium]
MGRHTIFVMLALTAMWVILVEDISWRTIAIGMFVSMLAMHYMGKYLKHDEVENVNFYKLATYPFWLIAKIYTDAFYLIRMIFSDTKCGISKEQLVPENDTLRMIMLDSVTLTPGTVFVELEGNEITLLSIEDRNADGYPFARAGLREIERVLREAHIPK